MSENEIPAPVQAFLAAHIQSVVQLEVLLLLHANPQRTWTPEQIATELRISQQWAADQLQYLTSRRLLKTDAPAGGSAAYRYAPGSAEIAEVMDALAKAYAERRVTITAMIFAQPPDALRSFADAFRIRKEKPDA